MALTDDVTTCAEDVQQGLGPHLRENAYQEALKVALSDRGIQFTEEATIPVLYRELPVARMHPDMIVGDDERIIVELKVDRDGTNQLLTYLDYAEQVGMDDITGGLVLSFGDDLTTNEL